MHRSQRTRHSAGVTVAETRRTSVSPESPSLGGPLVLFVTRDLELKDRLNESLSEFAGDSLTVECVDRLSDATQRLKRNDGVGAVLMDWDLPTPRGFESLLLLLGADPEMPIIILGDDDNLVVVVKSLQ